MILGNAMSVAALAADRMAGEMETRHAEIEAYLALGATRALRRDVMVHPEEVVGIVPPLQLH